MKPFADTSLLCALYRLQDNTVEADALVARFDEPLCISSLVAFEFRQSARLQVFRFSNDRPERISARHTIRGGHRTLDVLHVATAIHARMDSFLTFDENQAGLARAEGLKARP